ncbi:MAG TPA: polysaccharide biosynthesis tyrosine autokinase [Acidimicrobiales bacterium]|nr:polysaccharide biosynthesis tyrosine autokinase [Acidimicrobiales bacterium]
MPPAPGADGPVSRYVQGIWRRRVAILLAVLVIVGFSMVISSSRPTVYRATAEVLVQPNGVEAALDPGRPPADPERLVETEIRILASPAVREAVRIALGEAPAISAEPAGDADVIAIHADDGTPERAATIANAYADAYVAVRRQQTEDAATAATAEIQKRVGELQAQIDAIPPAQVGTGEPLEAQQSALRQQLDRLQVLRAVRSGASQVVTTAAQPTSPLSPRPGRAGLLAGILGLAFAAASAALLERMDDSLRSKDQLERIAGVPVIGSIPTVGSFVSMGRPTVVSLATPRSAASEAYRTLRTALQFLPFDRVSTVQVTSPTSGDGKTTTLVNLGVALARAGQHVVLVCCDLRRPKLHEFFGMTNDVGFTSVLLGKVPLSAALQQVPDQDRLYVLASGPLPPNPSELLSSRRAKEVLGSLRAEAEIVLIDSPPVLPVSDALIIGGLVDITLLVCAADRTSMGDITMAVEQLRQVEGPLAGAVLNGAGPESAYGGKYGYDTLEPEAPAATAKSPRANPPARTVTAKAPSAKVFGKAPSGRTSSAKTFGKASSGKASSGKPAPARPEPRPARSKLPARAKSPIRAQLRASRNPAKAFRPPKPRPPARSPTK